MLKQGSNFSLFLCIISSSVLKIILRNPQGMPHPKEPDSPTRLILPISWVSHEFYGNYLIFTHMICCECESYKLKLDLKWNMLWFCGERGRCDSALPGLMNNAGGLKTSDRSMKPHTEAIPFSSSIFQPILTFDSLLERKSLFPARQKAGFLDFPILNILISHHLAFEQHFKKSAFARHGKRSDFQNAINRPNRLENRVTKQTVP